jgi:hypothetical protein
MAPEVFEVSYLCALLEESNGFYRFLSVSPFFDNTLKLPFSIFIFIFIFKTPLAEVNAFLQVL